MKELSQWRTFYGELIIGGMMLLALALCPKEARHDVAPGVVLGLKWLGGWLAGKAGWQHHVNAKAAKAAQ